MGIGRFVAEKKPARVLHGRHGRKNPSCLSSQQKEKFFLNRFGYESVEKIFFLFVEDAQEAVFTLDGGWFACGLYAREGSLARPLDPPRLD